MKDKNAWTTYEETQLSELEQLCSDYREFLDKGKTERECTTLIVQVAKKAGYVDLATKTRPLKPGDKVYAVGIEKTGAMFKWAEDCKKSMRYRLT